MLATVFLLAAVCSCVGGTSIDHLTDDVDDLRRIVDAYVDKRDSQPLVHPYNGYESGKPKLVPMDQLNLKMKDAPQLNDEHTVDHCLLDYNGCGGEGTPQYLVDHVPFHNTLVGACNKHDMCYGCAKMHGWSQKACDDAFERDEEALCKEEFEKNKGFYSYLNRKHCIYSAKAYWLGVRTVGSMFYANESKGYCNQICAKEYAHPERKLVDKQDDLPLDHLNDDVDDLTRIVDALVHPYNVYESGK